MNPSKEQEMLVWSLMHDCFDALDEERREMWTADLERHLTPEKMVRELRTAAQLIEGFCIASEGVGLVSLLVANDCRERVRRALHLAQAEEREATGQE